MLTTLLIILLIISQLFCFYMITLLNAKVAKFKDIEIRQEQIMREMEESISLYLVEIKEENDRLIHELSAGKTSKKIENDGPTEDIINPIEQNNIDLTIPTSEHRPYVPKTVAYNAYNKYKTKPNNTESEVNRDEQEVNSETAMTPQTEMLDTEKMKTEQSVPLSFKQQVIKLHNEGKNIEQIAKLTNKGKTEIELLLKFQT